MPPQHPFWKQIFNFSHLTPNLNIKPSIYICPTWNPFSKNTNSFS